MKRFFASTSHISKYEFTRVISDLNLKTNFVPQKLFHDIDQVNEGAISVAQFVNHFGLKFDSMKIVKEEIGTKAKLLMEKFSNLFLS